MTTPARQAEADRVEAVYYWALAQIGAGTIEEAIILWDEVPATKQAALAGGWLSRAVSLVMSRRGIAREVALAYYRLVRALRTGTTIAKPGVREPQRVSLEMLRQEFEALVEQAADSRPQEAPDVPDPVGGSDSPLDSVAPVSEQPQPDLNPLDDDDAIILEELAELDQIIADEEAAAEEELAILLDELGIENLLKKLDEIDKELTAAEAEKQAQQAHADAGRRQAATAERISMNAARGLVYNLGEVDQRVMGWVRYSTTGTPCGWCAMLISRGPVYKTAKAATYHEHDEYHDNCHCIAVPVFSQEQYESSQLFALNREYSVLWPRVTQGLGGKDAISAWRRYFRQHARAQAA